MKLADQRCANHSAREAAARCPMCARYFCRECVVEHDGRMMCNGCVAKLAKSEAQPAAETGVKLVALAAMGVFVAWLIFHYLGLALARIPSEFHGGPN